MKSEIETEEVLRSRALESADDLDCPTPIAIVTPRFALGSQGVRTRIVDEAVMYAQARASVAAITVTREVDEPAMRRAARESMAGAPPREAFDVEPPTNVDARDSFEHVSTIEKNTAGFERTTGIEGRTTPHEKSPAHRVARDSAETLGSPVVRVARAPDVSEDSETRVASEPKRSTRNHPAAKVDAGDVAMRIARDKAETVGEPVVAKRVAKSRGVASEVKELSAKRVAWDHDTVEPTPKRLAKTHENVDVIAKRVENTRGDVDTIEVPTKREAPASRVIESSREPILLVGRKDRGSMSPREMPVVIPAVIAARPIWVAPEAAARGSRSMPITTAARAAAEPHTRPGTTIGRRASRMLVAVILIGMAGTVAMGATYLIARDVRRDDVASTPMLAAPVVNATQRMPVTQLAPAAGTLHFSVEPVDATIRIDDITYASSTIELPIGSHVVEVTRRGYAKWRRRIEVTARSTDVFVALAHTPKRRVVRVRVPTPLATAPAPIVEAIEDSPPKAPVTNDEPRTQADDEEDPLRYLSTPPHR